MRAEEVIQEVVRLCRKYQAAEVILFGSRAKGTAQLKSDIDIAVSGVTEFEDLKAEIEDLPTLYSVDLVDLDSCRNHLLLEDIQLYGQKIYKKV